MGMNCGEAPEAGRYFVISTGPDGVSVSRINKQTLLQRLNEGYWGDVAPGPMPTDSNPEYWGTSLVIIKGDVVTPREKRTVLEYEVD